MHVGLCLIATNRYEQYIRPLLNDVRDHYFLQDDVVVYLFTDKYHDDIDAVQPWINRFEVIQIPVPSYKFPQASLYRFDFFTEHRGIFEDDDFLYFMDVDMNIVADVGRDMLPKVDMVGVHHARCWSADGTWETRSESRAYVSPEKRLIYYAGGVFGGDRVSFLKMSEELSHQIHQDEYDNVMAVWHDESHLNRYFADHLPTVLAPTYCFPPNPAPELEEFTDPKIVCIIKDHKEIRR